MNLDLAVDVVQFIVLLVLAAANGVIAYSVYRIQKDRKHTETCCVHGVSRGG